MKNLEKLQLLIKQLTKKEINKFKEYGDYKPKKNAVKLYKLILKNKNEVTSDRLHLEIKRKGLDKNLRYTVEELYKLILDFWADNTKQTDRVRDINKLIIQSTILENKGLKKEGIKLLKIAAKKADDIKRFELKAFAICLAYSREITSYPKQSLQLSKDFLLQQQETLNQQSTYYETLSLYYQGHYLISKGVQMLDKKESQQLIEIRSKVEVLVKNPNLSLPNFIQMGSLLSLLYYSVTPSNFKLAEQYRLENFKRFEEGLYTGSLIYQIELYNHLIFMFYTKRVDDYKTYRHIMLADQEISKSTPTIYTGLRCITLVMLHLLEFNKENAQQAIDDSWDYYQKKGSEDSFIIRWNLLFCCFQLAFSIGNFKQAALFVDELNAAEFVNSEMKQYKFIARQASLLLHYQNKNEEWVLNQISSVKRLYSGHLKKNVGGNLLLKLLVRLSSTPNKKEKQTLFNRFLVDLNSVFEQYPEHQFLFTFTIIEDWVRATMNGYDTIFDYKN